MDLTASQLPMPKVEVEAEATPVPVSTLGQGAAVQSRLSVGRSDAIAVKAGDVLADSLLAAHLRENPEVALLRLTFRMSFRPAPGERFERALFSVVLVGEEEASAPPFARLLAPERLSAGPFTVQRQRGGALQLGASGAGLHREGSTTKSVEVAAYYVIAAGLGESDPEWRYTRTETMELVGSHEMAMVVELPREARGEARLSLSATVRAGRRQRDLDWDAPAEVGRVPLAAGGSQASAGWTPDLRAGP
jgi:hypothetical protein